MQALSALHSLSHENILYNTLLLIFAQRPLFLSMFYNVFLDMKAFPPSDSIQILPRLAARVCFFSKVKEFLFCGRHPVRISWHDLGTLKEMKRIDTTHERMYRHCCFMDQKQKISQMSLSQLIKVSKPTSFIFQEPSPCLMAHTSSSAKGCH